MIFENEPLLPIRPTCTFIGCANLASYNRKSQGYRKFCNTHHRKKYGISNLNRQDKRKRLIPNSKCVKCGWDGPCDRHRVKMGKYGGGYTTENVLVLCPNCHRLLHLSKGSLNRNYVLSSVSSL
mgnify:CR=1 FL=1